MIDSSLLLRLKLERKRLGLSQEAVAARVGVERETWSRYENGHMQPGTEVWKALAGLGADVNYILSGLGAQQEHAQYAAGQKLDARKSALLENYDHMSEEDRRTMERTASALAQSTEVSKAKGGK